MIDMSFYTGRKSPNLIENVSAESEIKADVDKKQRHLKLILHFVNEIGRLILG